MIKVFSFLSRSAQLSHEQFLERWDDAATVLSTASDVQESVRRYVRNVPVPDAVVPGLPLADFDGFAETWFDDAPAAEAALQAPAARQLVTGDAWAFVEPARRIVVAAEEAIQFDHGWGDVKFVGLSKRGPGFSHDEWCRYWVDVHGPLAYGVPEFARYYGRYVHNYILPGGLGPVPAQSDYDGIVEEWVRSVEDFVRCGQEPRYLEVIRPDEQRFVEFGGSRFMMVHERELFSSD